MIVVDHTPRSLSRNSHARMRNHTANRTTLLRLKPVHLVEAPVTYLLLRKCGARTTKKPDDRLSIRLYGSPSSLELSEPLPVPEPLP